MRRRTVGSSRAACGHDEIRMARMGKVIKDAGIALNKLLLSSTVYEKHQWLIKCWRPTTLPTYCATNI